MIAIATYMLVVLIMFTLGVQKPFINAIIPAVGYMLSTLSISIVKEWWIEKRRFRS